MKTDEASVILKPYTDKCKEDGDTAFAVHFSKEGNNFQAFNEGLDMGDALIIIDGLIRHYGIDPPTVVAMYEDNKEDHANADQFNADWEKEIMQFSKKDMIDKFLRPAMKTAYEASRTVENLKKQHDK